MSKVVLNPLLDSLSGKLGNAVLRKRGERIFLTQRPGERRTPITPQEEAYRLRFLQACAYGKAVLKDPTAKSYYAEKMSSKEYRTIYNLAVGDYLKAPKIQPLQLSNYHGEVGDTIGIPAFEKGGVKRVDVTITSAAGVVLEQGPASLPDGSAIWEYKVAAQNTVLPGTTIEVVAQDRPGNETLLKTVL